ncbi:MAG: hypothetical protein ABIR32_03720 [Ilumatobacteraceae bacterium]
MPIVMVAQRVQATGGSNVMASVVPTIIELDEYPMDLGVADLQVLDALLSLDPGWTVFVRPLIDWHQPDFVVMHPEFGVCVIVVKDWPAGSMQATSSGLLVRHAADGWYPTAEAPFQQLELARQAIITQVVGDRIGDRSALDGPADTAIRGVVILPGCSTQDACQLLHRPPSPAVRVWGGTTLDTDVECIVHGHPRPQGHALPSATTDVIRQRLTAQIERLMPQCA